ncbi:ATPase, partial [Candidatus Gottesmanbacteria bacterium CG_4_10_14_0_8_um_filter_37_24]|uniref:Cation-transporting P-type ATPase N-terminal domain-containing protein n=3 Tax=Candidatus Gottesmaniibacteriota TaxID=1752720 RepID=A0A1J4TLJ8_9BACT
MYHLQTIEETLKAFNTDKTRGLSQKEVSLRLKKYGSNVLPVKKKPPIFFKFINQFKDLLVIILLAATLVSLLLGETIDAIAIATIVLINATIGFIQEIQAEKTLESLKQKEILYALVQRQGEVEKIPFSDIVPGDILILEEGAKIPADGRIVESFSLRIDESILTGESLPVSKNSKPLISKENIPLADRLNMVYKETEVIAGRGKAVVTGTAQSTEIGKIALFLGEEAKTKTPLSIELEKVGRMLTIVIGIIALVIFVFNFLAKTPFIDSLLISISLAVAAIPEGLPAIVTIVLSLGVKRLALKKSVVKKLSACETLGSIKIIATDKTGTLTQNKINVVKIILSTGDTYLVKGEGYNAQGTFFSEKGKIVNPLSNHKLESLLRAGALGSDASVKGTQVIGDTTEASLIVAAIRAKLDVNLIKETEPTVFEVPFTSERKMMSKIVQVNETSAHMLYTKGAPEVILEKCNLTDKEKDLFLNLTKKLALDGLRSLAVACKPLTKKEVEFALEKDSLSEENLEFMGIVGMQDPLRPEIIEALDKARMAGIRTIMITGDHKLTAGAIAKEAGIIKEGDKVLTEDDIHDMSIKELAREITKGANVFARISPMMKLNIVKAIKSIPNTLVAVTGDGVNDAPALKESHIGIAMGKTGTDITREVADIVITDDNYATIIDAVREGRVIFANLVKFIRYLISCNLSEVLVVASAVAIGVPNPLLPIQLLWINLITDGMPALALGVDPPEFDVMRRPPRDITNGLLHKKRWFYMVIEGGIIAASTFFLFIYALNKYSYPTAQTIAFSILTLSQLVHAFNNRSTRKSLFSLGIFSNKYLVGATVISLILQFLVVQTSFGNVVFKTSTLTFNQWALIILASLTPLWVVELKKLLRFRLIP